MTYQPVGTVVKPEPSPLPHHRVGATDADAERTRADDPGARWRRIFGHSRHQRALIGGGHAEQIALGAGYAEADHQIPLFGRVDAFHHHAATQGAGDLRHHLDNDFLGLVVHGGEHEIAVDLDHVERDPLQIPQGRIAGAEIVERHPDFQRFEFQDDVSNHRVIVDHRAFGNLEFEAMTGKTGSLERAHHRLLEPVGVLELRGTDADGDFDVLAPGRCIHASRHQDACAERLDQSDILGHLDEDFRTDEPEVWIDPARERFGSDHIPGRHVDNRLIMRMHEILLDGLSKLELDDRFALQRPFHPRIEHDGGVAVRGLSGIEGYVGVADQVLGLNRHVGGVDADAATDVSGAGLQHKGGRENVHDTVGRGHRVVRGHQDEFVAADTRDGRGFAVRDGHQALGYLAEELIAGRMPLSVVDDLEAIEVHEKNRDVEALGKFPLQDLGELAAVREPGQVVIARHFLFVVNQGAGLDRILLYFAADLTDAFEQDQDQEREQLRHRTRHAEHAEHDRQSQNDGLNTDKAAERRVAGRVHHHVADRDHADDVTSGFVAVKHDVEEHYAHRREQRQTREDETGFVQADVPPPDLVREPRVVEHYKLADDDYRNE